MRPSLLLTLLALPLSLVACSSGAPRAAGPHVPSASPSAAGLLAPTPTPDPSPDPLLRPAAARSASPQPSPRASAVSTPRSKRLAASRYVFPVRGCAVHYGDSHHDYPATDIFAARGCRVVSPVSGVVDEVSTVDRWRASTNRGADRGGLSFSVVGVDGVRYYGSHLSTVLVRAGQHVVAGQQVGTVGNSGDARGIATHLHFGISWPTRHGVWWVRRGEVYPWPYLDSWRVGGRRSPASAVQAKHARLGDVPPCSVDC